MRVTVRINAIDSRNDMTIKRDQCSYVAPVIINSLKLLNTKAPARTIRVMGTNQKNEDEKNFSE